MPAQPRPQDNFTRDALLLGFSIVEFTPTLPSGSGVPVPIGILSGESIQKTIDNLQLEDGSSGTLVVNREVISRFETNYALETFNFQPPLARYIFGSETTETVTADAAAQITDEQLKLQPDPLAFEVFNGLQQATIDEATVEVKFQAIVAEQVGTGDGASNDFQLVQKVKAMGDVTSVLVGTTSYTPVASGAATTGNEVEVIVGETDGAHPTGSGSLEFFVGGVTTPPTAGQDIVADYEPSFTTVASDLVNLTDFTVDPFLGRIRFLNAGTDDSPFRPTGAEARLLVDYQFNRKAYTKFKPWTQLTFEGSAVVRHLPDTGVNFLHDIPSATIVITDDEITFGAEDFATGPLQLNVNDAGGTDRYGTLQWYTEPQQKA